MKCMWCRQELRFVPGRGWVHADGGGTYQMHCPECGWRGSLHPSPTRCPQCGSREVRDDHAALPDRPDR